MREGRPARTLVVKEDVSGSLESIVLLRHPPLLRKLFLCLRPSRPLFIGDRLLLSEPLEVMLTTLAWVLTPPP